MPSKTKAAAPAVRGSLLDVSDCAAYIGTSERHVRRLVTERRIPYTKLSSARNARLRFNTAKLDAWLEEHSVWGEGRVPWHPEHDGSKEHENWARDYFDRTGKKCAQCLADWAAADASEKPEPEPERRGRFLVSR